MRGRLLLLATSVLAAIGSILVSSSSVAAVIADGAAGQRFVSQRYGYTLALPGGWHGTAATTSFRGGDIDHTASYVDSYSAPDERLVFVLGRPTKATVGAYTNAHSAWLVANRPCRSLGPARRVELARGPARLTRFTCDGGVYGSTFVVKWTAVRGSRGVIVTQFSPEGRRAADVAVLARLLATFRWR